MSKQLFKTVSTGLGIGLLAATLSVSAKADLHGFASSMIFYKGGVSPTYVVNVPTGNQATDNALLLEVGVGDATKGTFTIGFNYTPAGLVTGSNEKVVFSVATSDANSISIVTLNGLGAQSTYPLSVVASNHQIALWGHSASYSYYVPGSSLMSQTFAGTASLGSGTAGAQCFYSMVASIDTDGNFKIATATNSHSASIVDVQSLTLFVSHTSNDSITHAATALWFPLVSVTSSLAAADWTSYAVTNISQWDAQTNGTLQSSIFKSAYATSVGTLGTSNSSNAFPITNWPSAAQTVIAKINTCNGVYANRVALNSSGLIIGGNNGLGRIW